MSPGWFRDWEREQEQLAEWRTENPERIAECEAGDCGGCINCWGVIGVKNTLYRADTFRTEAFGAIRRAAEVARYYDREAARPPSIDIWGDALEASHYHDWAHAVRLAIRAAIGSPKA